MEETLYYQLLVVNMNIHTGISDILMTKNRLKNIYFYFMCMVSAYMYEFMYVHNVWRPEEGI